MFCENKIEIEMDLLDLVYICDYSARLNINVIRLFNAKTQPNSGKQNEPFYTHNVKINWNKWFVVMNWSVVNILIDVIKTFTSIKYHMILMIICVFVCLCVNFSFAFEEKKDDFLLSSVSIYIWVLKHFECNTCWKWNGYLKAKAVNTQRKSTSKRHDVDDEKKSGHWTNETQNTFEN